LLPQQPSWAQASQLICLQQIWLRRLLLWTRRMMKALLLLLLQNLWKHAKLIWLLLLLPQPPGLHKSQKLQKRKVALQLWLMELLAAELQLI